MTASFSSSIEPRRVPAGLVARGELRPPPSKSLTQRYYNLALLATGASEIERPLRAEDSDSFLAGVEAAGCRVERTSTAVRIEPPTAASSVPPSAPVAIDCRASGTMLRLLTASLAALPGRWLVDGTDRLRERPMAPLLGALSELGAVIESRAIAGHAPLEIAGGSLRGGTTTIDAGESSQYVSALLMAGVATPRGVTLRLDGLVSAPYVDLTAHSLERFGLEPPTRGSGVVRVESGRPAGARVAVEADASSACYPAAAALLTGGEVEIAGMGEHSPQPDIVFFSLLERIGARMDWKGGGVRVSGGGTLTGVEADLGEMPDQVPTLAAIAPFASGTTILSGVPHLRLKESDRLAALATELSRLGVPVEERPDGLEIEGCWAETDPPAEPVVVGSHDDHRIAMSLALVGLRRPGVAVADPKVVDKSYPAFWDDLERLLAR